MEWHISLPSVLAVCTLLLSTLVAVASAQEEDNCMYTDATPYITFMGSRLPNHSYVDIGVLGNAYNGSNVLQCHTDLETCCSSGIESVTHTGEWFLPNGLLVDSSAGGDYHVREGDQRIDLAYEGSGGSTGIFRCAVPTNAVNDVSNTARESVYVGIYNNEDSELIVEIISHNYMPYWYILLWRRSLYKSVVYI